MGHKTVTFSNETEQKTYVQGEFTGKYRGVLNDRERYSNFECYNIQIYKGEINNFRNEIDHPEIINETIYNTVVSETQLAQKSFDNVLVNLDHPFEDYDSFRLAIKEPKLESVKIYNVVKDGNQTFGTINCFVSGYLSKTSIETSEIEVETCDNCNQFLEECTCNDNGLSKVTFHDEPVSTPPFEATNSASYPKKNKNWGWAVLDNSGFGCLGLFGLLFGILVLVSFGLPGILIGAFILLIYAISGPLTRTFPNLSKGFRWLFYALIGLLFLGWLFYAISLDTEVNTFSSPEQRNELIKTQNTEEIKKFPNSNPVKSKSKNEETNTSAKQNATFETDSITNRPQESTGSQKIESTNLPKLSSPFPSKESNSSYEESINSQNEPVNVTSILVPEFQNDQANGTPQTLGDSQNNVSKGQKKLKKTPEIMTGIIFHEGEVFICKGDSSTRYHFDPDCPGLSNCSTRIYQINIPEAERLGRTLCKREY